MNARSRWLLPAALTALGVATLTLADPPRGPVKVTVKDGRVVASAEIVQPIDPTPRIVCQFAGNSHFGLTVEGKRLCCSPQGSIWSAMRIDGGQIIQNGQNGVAVQQNAAPQPLPPGPNGQKRQGYTASWNINNVHVTQVIEIVPSRSTEKKLQNEKRKLDTTRISYLIENKDSKAHKVDYRTSIDMMINNNDGALYASPTTQPGKILNGVALEGKDLPAYLWCVENPDYNNPGFYGVMTLKGTGGDWPNKVVLSNLGAVGQGFNMWDIPAQPAGDSACAIYWDAKEIPAGGKRTLYWGYGGGLASDPEPEGKVSLGLAGSFEPGKLFSLMATVDDPAPNQALTLELPAGMERVEGREIQPVPPAGERGSSVVLWKARVQRTGEYAIRVHSSAGSTQVKHVTIEAQ